MTSQKVLGSHPLISMLPEVGPLQACGFIEYTLAI
jgi:hypothetical protein